MERLIFAFWSASCAFFNASRGAESSICTIVALCFTQSPALRETRDTTPEPYAAMQSDISCMLSPEMYEQFVVPELDLVGRAFGNVWYHLDGQDAFQHLPRLLSLPYLRVVQFTPRADTAPNGPAHLDLYRKIQAAGKIVHIALPPENVEPLVRQLDPGLLCLDTGCRSIAEGEALLEAARRWTAAGK